jgi:hypothetical protein
MLNLNPKFKILNSKQIQMFKFSKFCFGYLRIWSLEHCLGFRSLGFRVLHFDFFLPNRQENILNLRSDSDEWRGY